MSYKTLTVILLNILPNLLGTPLNSRFGDDESGFLSSRIVGGIDAPYGYAKHMVALVYNSHSFTMLSCGGSIITNRHILSAAHCIQPYLPVGNSRLFYGSLGSNYWFSLKYIVYFKKGLIHPAYDPGYSKNDIGILITKTRIIFNEVIAPIALKFEKVDERLDCFVTGWGNNRLYGETPDKLQLLYLKTITAAQCVKDIEEATAGVAFALPYDPDNEICTFHSHGHGMCHGDSGSALVCVGGQVGIVSWGFPCARGAPDVYARVSPHRDWLRNVTASL